MSEIDEPIALLAFLDDYADELETEVYVTFFDDVCGLVSYLCTLSSYKEVILPGYRNYYSVECKLNQQVKVIQRRSDIKVKTDFPAEISYLDYEDEELWADITVKDMSAGGLFFTSTEELPIGQEFTFFFNQGTRPFLLTGVVLRMQETEEEELFGYGCKFIQLSAAKEAIIREFVFRQQVQKKI